ncbi:Glycosyltransferase involved in cell wall bisynthesis [Brevibacterium siliguriense]|uniref:Glycosyltransferase involved in cell wall bisynthesis n=1 Tax=Brevibacterium siliguriense TaxID=1136497 RepID=A0A1H1PF65_9MICO|nr:glycosyltransferase family 4 protein [Brevibacterium siliguriense]SDS09906.1 Glycosyltransferase involved in cell wall bisynthesis [Brevibacterium siliguriense]
MRIAYVLLDPGIGVFGTKGASVHVQEVVRTFRALGHEVSIFCTRTDDDVPTDLADIDVTRLEVPRGLDRSQREIALLRLSDLLADLVTDTVAASGQGFDLVYERYSLFSTAGARISQRLDVPLIMEVNAPLLEEQRTHRGLVHAEHAARATAAGFAGAARIVCVSELVADWVRTDYPGLDDVSVVPNGVNTQRITPRNGAGYLGDGTSQQHGPVRIGFVGTLKPWHGTDRLIAACAGLVGDFRVDIVGHGPEAEALENQVRRLGLGRHVRFHGALAPEAVPEALREFDIAVAPYPAGENYFSPLKVYEYLAAGLPVIASGVGAIPGLLADTGAAILTDPADTTDLTRALQRLIDDAELRATMGGRAREEALTSHSWTRRCQQILAPVTGTTAVETAAGETVAAVETGAAPIDEGPSVSGRRPASAVRA